ncbi:laccase [Artemisia annua]|uniref:Laccase n=1 Tax=Artemisia annua TaxID=35608 RepID=A0A2U1KTK4_ARTAN|nr:laccase [Artemisia annua]
MWFIIRFNQSSLPNLSNPRSKFCLLLPSLFQAKSTDVDVPGHGLLVVSPKNRTTYQFPKPDVDVPVIVGDWWKNDILTVMEDFLRRRGDPTISDALTINSQPGGLYNCSHQVVNGTCLLD